jgi:uncharacterized protein (TIGR02594 family)
MSFDHDSFMQAWRAARLSDGSKISQNEYSLVMRAIKGLWEPPVKKLDARDPVWITTARSLIGQREIKGPQHNSWISNGWARLGAGWFNDDETPWCGFFVAHCVDAAGLPYPGKGLFARAKAWLEWGEETKPCYGCVVVFGRSGGGHVGFLVGESSTNYYVLGGNQGDAVNITPIAKSRALGYRWPTSVKNHSIALPAMSGGVVSTNEA